MKLLTSIPLQLPENGFLMISGGIEVNKSTQNSKGYELYLFKCSALNPLDTKNPFKGYVRYFLPFLK